MARVFRVMRRDADSLPTVSQTSLGIPPGVDVDLDAQNNVQVNGKGMSVAPNWRDININRIPKRLRPLLGGAGGSNNTFCFRRGDGPFRQGHFASGLTLEPSSATHGNVAPAQIVPLATYEAAIDGNPPELAGRRDMITAAKPLMTSPAYLAMVRGTRALHDLLAAGKDDSPEADAVRDATDGPWQALSEVERNRIRTLSEDLYSLIEPPAAAQPMNLQSQAKLNEAIEARQRGEWDSALDLLRQWRAYIDPALLSYLRGSIWLEAGDPATAALFYAHAYTLEPTSGNYQALALYALNIADPAAARKQAEEILKQVPPSWPGTKLIQSLTTKGTAE